MDKQKANNKGITLVELLIAIAIGSIVISAVIILLRQGINSYTKQTISAQLQNDANITLNQMTDAIMEAKCIDIANNTSGTGNTPDFITRPVGSDSANAYSYDSTGQVLYVGMTPALNNYQKLGILCKNVTSFKVQILKSSVKIETQIVDNGGGSTTESRKITDVYNPVQIKVSLKLEYHGVSRDVSRVTAIRNELDLSKFTLQGSPFSDFIEKSHIDPYFTD